MWKQNKNASSPLISIKKKMTGVMMSFFYEKCWDEKCVSDFWNSKYNSLRPFLGEAEKEVNGA